MAKSNVAARGRQTIGNEAYYRHRKQGEKFTKRGHARVAEMHFKKMEIERKASS